MSKFPNMEYAESLGLGLFCLHCDLIAIAVWDSEAKVWKDENDEPLLGFFCTCDHCASVHRLPMIQDVEAYEKEFK